MVDLVVNESNGGNLDKHTLAYVRHMARLFVSQNLFQLGKGRRQEAGIAIGLPSAPLLNTTLVRAAGRAQTNRPTIDPDPINMGCRFVNSFATLLCPQTGAR